MYNRSSGQRTFSSCTFNLVVHKASLCGPRLSLLDFSQHFLLQSLTLFGKTNSSKKKFVYNFIYFIFIYKHVVLPSYVLSLYFKYNYVLLFYRLLLLHAFTFNSNACTHQRVFLLTYSLTNTFTYQHIHLYQQIPSPTNSFTNT